MAASHMIRRAACALVPLALAGCPGPTHKIAPYLRDALGLSWTMVPLPNSGMSPGAILQVMPVGTGSAASAAQLDIRWLGRLEDCGVPAAALAVSDAVVPAINAGDTYSIDASLGASLAGVSGKLGANASSTADFVVSKSTDSSLNFIGFQSWAADPGHAAVLGQRCGPSLALPGVYVVQEAFIVSDGSYTFKTTGGGDIAVQPPPNVPVKLSAGGSTGNTGALTITSPIVFALKVLQPLPRGGFQTATIDTHPVAGPAAAGAVASLPHHHMVALRPLGAEPPPPPPPAAPPPPPVAAALPPLLLGGKSIGQVQGLTHP